jgi:hypothetical protein
VEELYKSQSVLSHSGGHKMKSLLRRLLVIFPLLILFVPLIGDTTEANDQQLRETFRRVKQCTEAASARGLPSM